MKREVNSILGHMGTDKFFLDSRLNKTFVKCPKCYKLSYHPKCGCKNCGKSTTY